MFQQSNRLLETMDETKEWYSQKHKLFGYKVKVSVPPNGHAVNCLSHGREKTSDTTTVRGNQEFHDNALLERSEDSSKVIVDVLSAEYLYHFAVHVDKDYQRLTSNVRAVYPFCQPAHGTLSLTAGHEHDKISHDPIIVESIF